MDDSDFLNGLLMARLQLGEAGMVSTFGTSARQYPWKHANPHPTVLLAHTRQHSPSILPSYSLRIGKSTCNNTILTYSLDHQNPELISDTDRLIIAAQKENPDPELDNQIRLSLTDVPSYVIETYRARELWSYFMALHHRKTPILASSFTDLNFESAENNEHSTLAHLPSSNTSEAGILYPGRELATAYEESRAGPEISRGEISTTNPSELTSIFDSVAGISLADTLTTLSTSQASFREPSIAGHHENDPARNTPSRKFPPPVPHPIGQRDVLDGFAILSRDDVTKSTNIANKIQKAVQKGSIAFDQDEEDDLLFPYITYCPREARKSGNSRAVPYSSSNRSGSKPRPSFTTRGADDNIPEGDDAGDKGSRNRKESDTVGDTVRREARLACPYVKRFPDSPHPRTCIKGFTELKCVK